MQEFIKDLNWFVEFLPSTNGVFIMLEDNGQPINLFNDACNTGAGAVADDDEYHSKFPHHIIDGNHTICHLETLNILKTWASKF